MCLRRIARVVRRVLCVWWHSDTPQRNFKHALCRFYMWWRKCRLSVLKTTVFVCVCVYVLWWWVAVWFLGWHEYWYVKHRACMCVWMHGVTVSVRIRVCVCVCVCVRARGKRLCALRREWEWSGFRGWISKYSLSDAIFYLLFSLSLLSSPPPIQPPTPSPPRLPSSASGVKCYSLLVVTVANHLTFCSNCFQGNGEIRLPGTESNACDCYLFI